LVDKLKIEKFFFPPIITNILIGNNSKISDLTKNKKYIFYPAQFWPHKNHVYLLESLKKYNENKAEKFFLIFTGHDKGNLKFIKNKINNLGIMNEVIIFNYISEEEICYLYKHCFAVAFPSLVGSQSLPLFESFFFQKPIMYNEKILDQFYANATLPLNIDDYQNLGFNIEKIINNPKLINYQLPPEPPPPKPPPPNPPKPPPPEEPPPKPDPPPKPLPKNIPPAPIVNPFPPRPLPPR
jgi:glycosyltransferase involved in cell wall biosynthesis